MAKMTDFHFGGFHFYVTWEDHGEWGRDQHGRIWFNIKNPYSEEGIEKLLIAFKNALLSTNISKLNQYEQNRKKG